MSENLEIALKLIGEEYFISDEEKDKKNWAQLIEDNKLFPDFDHITLL